MTSKGDRCFEEESAREKRRPEGEEERQSGQLGHGGRPRGVSGTQGLGWTGRSSTRTAGASQEKPGGRWDVVHMQSPEGRATVCNSPCMLVTIKGHELL